MKTLLPCIHFFNKKQFENLHFSRRHDSHKQNEGMYHPAPGWMPVTQITVKPCRVDTCHSNHCENASYSDTIRKENRVS